MPPKKKRILVSESESKQVAKLENQVAALEKESRQIKKETNSKQAKPTQKRRGHEIDESSSRKASDKDSHLGKFYTSEEGKYFIQRVVSECAGRMGLVMNCDEIERLKLKPDEEFKHSFQLPRDNSAVFLQKGEKKRMFQAFRHMLVGMCNGTYGISELKTNEEALKELQAEVAILLFWGWSIVEICPQEPNICCAPPSLFD